MANDRGVTCPRCGASTPLPEDLRVASFSCAFCHAELETAVYAGKAAVSADALVGHLQTVLEDPSAAMKSIHLAPKFQGGDTRTGPASCLRCGAPVAVPLDLDVRELTCGACHVAQPIHVYISDDERFALDMARQVAGNEALKRLQAGGIPCTKCGGKNPVPDDGSVQLACAHCGATVLLSDHVDATAVARQRLKHGAFAVRDELMRKQQQRDRWTKIVIPAVIVLALLGFVISNLIMNR